MNRTNTAANPRLVVALGYAKRGWAVLACQPRGKAPATKHGFKDATTQNSRIVPMWAANGSANVGIATGGVSGIVVLDVDPRNGGDASLLELERAHGSLPETVSVSTGGGGRHFYFAAPKGAVRSGVLADGLDFKADGGYVVAPPSMHPDGGQYRWLNDPARTNLAPCPEWIRPSSKTKARQATPAASAPDAGATPLGRAFANVGMLGRLLDGGKRTVVCPWQEKHTTGALQDSSSVIFAASAPNGLGGFHCSHAHCASRIATEALRELERRAAAGTAERAWMAELRRTPKGELKASFGNLVQILSHDPSSAGKLRLDEMRGAVLQKWLAAGVMEHGTWTETKRGSRQGATISPLLANVYLHYVFDTWANQWRKRSARGDVVVGRYADDTVVGFQYHADAVQFLAELRDRLRSSRLNCTLRKPG